MSYLSRTVTAADGVQTAFPVSFPYQNQADVEVYVYASGGTAGPSSLKAAGVDYDWTSAGTITFRPGHVPASGTSVDTRRASTITNLGAEFQAGGALRSADVKLDDIQLLYLAQEVTDALADESAQVAVLQALIGNLAKGDPGANISAFGALAILGTIHIPVGTNMIRSTGYASDGDGGAADYVYDAAVNAAYVAANPYTSKLDAGGRGFKFVPGAVVTPEQVGLKGDGTDDYAAFKALAGLLSGSVKTTCRFSRKTYTIAQHANGSNGVGPILIQNATGLTIDGNGATISFDGNFDRSVAGISGIGIQLINCVKSRMFGFTLNGNVQQTTNSSNSTESFQGYGLYVAGCIDCEFSSIESHHFPTDGFAVGPWAPGGPVIGSKRISVSRVHAHHNARSNLSVFTAEYVHFKQCVSDFAGTTDGAYPGHSPLCGMDVEPDESVESGTADVDANHISMEDCRFENNSHGGDFFATLQPAITGPVTFNRVRIVSATTTAASAVIIGVPFEGNMCWLDMGGQRLELPAGASGLVTHLFDDCDIRGSCLHFEIINSSFLTKATTLRDTRITCTATGAKTAGVNALTINNAAFVFEGTSELFLPAPYFLDEGSGACKAFDIIVRHADGLKLYTTLATALKYFYSKWNTSVVRKARYKGSTPGTLDNFRPALSSLFDTNLTYSLGDGFEGHGGIDALTDASVTLGLYSKMVQRLDVPITAARTTTLPVPGNQGRRFRIVRTANATGAFNHNINTNSGVLVKAIATAGNCADVVDDGTEYRLVGGGPL